MPARYYSSRLISEDTYNYLMRKQKGVCVICRKPETILHRKDNVEHRFVRRLATDHCHKTGKVRGLLCGACNRGIGLFRDNPKLLRIAAKYLEQA